MRTSIIGAGKVGMSLASHLLKKGILDYVFCRTDCYLSEFKHKIKKLEELEVKLQSCELLIISVPDTQISNVATELANLPNYLLKDKLVFHCSGSLNENILEPLRIIGAKTAAAHPLQTFSKIDDLLLHDIYWAVECTEKDKNVYIEYLKSIDGKPFFLNYNDKEQKILYHASAVMASNFMHLYLEKAIELAEKANLSREIFLPLCTQTLLNFFNSEISTLTGPVSRADINTIKLHLELLNIYPDIKKFYQTNSVILSDLALKAEIINQDQFSDLSKILLKK
ncbi:MAG: DUF2520 domain-containing protein [Candidatus Kapabacteria bacterium]|nr:DUF2520 domain-containing protein [Candidatus Kapabacteria bacterium]